MYLDVFFIVHLDEGIVPIQPECLYKMSSHALILDSY